MSSLSEAKNLGGIGAILILLLAVPSIGWILSIVGFILVLIAVRSISHIVGDKSIFNNMAISVVTSIVAIAVIGIVVIAALFSVLGISTFNGTGFNMPANVSAGQWVTFALIVLPGLVASWVLLIVSAIFLRRSLGSMGTRLNVGLFDTAGLLYLIGAILVIVFIGFILILVAEILLAVAFFSINENYRAAAPAQTV